jgi:hypothetical protein
MSIKKAVDWAAYSFLNHCWKVFLSLSREARATATEYSGSAELLLTLPILMSMSRVQGWLAVDEADLLIAAAARALIMLPQPHAIVEVGSYCGRSTVVLGSVVRAVCPKARVYAIDPHRGTIALPSQGLRTMPATLEKCRRNLTGAGLAEFVEIIQRYSFDVTWNQRIGLLLIDGLHDYANVARDFAHFESWIMPMGYVAFHDYSHYFPGVMTFVNDIVGAGTYRMVHCVRSMMVIQKVGLASLPTVPCS